MELLERAKPSTVVVQIGRPPDFRALAREYRIPLVSIRVNLMHIWCVCVCVCDSLPPRAIS